MVVEADCCRRAADNPMLGARSEDRNRWLWLAEIALRREQDAIKSKIRPAVDNYQRLVHKTPKVA